MPLQLQLYLQKGNATLLFPGWCEFIKTETVFSSLCPLIAYCVGPTSVTQYIDGRMVSIHALIGLSFVLPFKWLFHI